MALTKKQNAAFTALSAAIAASSEGFIFAAQSDVNAFVLAGLVETNDTIKDETGNIAVRLKVATEGEGTNVMTNSTQTAAVAASAFAIATVALPAASGRGRGGNTYPFDALEVGQSFFVPNSESKPNAAKSLASTVSGATARHAIVDPSGATKTNRKGVEGPVTIETRKFVVRAQADGAPWGHAGVAGAGVWRTK